MSKQTSACLLLVILAALVSGFHVSVAQSYSNLHQLKGHQVEVYFSDGAETKATRMANQLDRVISFYDQHLHFQPSVRFLVLSPNDWSTYAKGAVYGMPHYTTSATLIIASEDNDFWRSFIPPVDKLPKDLAQSVAQAYSSQAGGLSMEPFFDLLAIHELGHAYHMQDSLKMQRKWMGELFVNMFLHTYIAEKEPELLPALTVFPRMVVATTQRLALKYTSLEDLEIHYNGIAQKFPQNYGWYQCKWHMAAGDIYDKGKVKAFEDLWIALKKQKVGLDDPAFVSFLNKVHPGLADVPSKWNQD